MRGSWILALAGTLTLPRIAASQRPTGAADTTARVVDRAFGAWRGTAGCGCALGVSRDGRGVCEQGCGMANLETGTPIRPSVSRDERTSGDPWWVAAMAVLRRPVPDSLVMTVDSARHQITLAAGPYHVPTMDSSADHTGMDHGAAHNTPLHRFQWPIEGWLRGFRIAIVNGRGAPIPHSVLHHLIVVNFSRRALLYPMFERLIGAGGETADASVPATVGVPMQQGMLLGMYVGWHNETDRSLDDIYVRVTLLWIPRNQVPPPTSILPVHIDAHETVGLTDSYDLMPGRTEMTYEFQLPVGGRLLGIGGHMHDYGVSVRLEDLEAGSLVSELRARRDETGRILGLNRQLFGVWGRGIKLHANRRYRIVGVYDNPTGRTLVGAGMANMLGLFAPDNLQRWPAVDLEDPVLQQDLASLASFGRMKLHEE